MAPGTRKLGADSTPAYATPERVRVRCPPVATAVTVRARGGRLVRPALRVAASLHGHHARGDKRGGHRRPR